MFLEQAPCTAMDHLPPWTFAALDHLLPWTTRRPGPLAALGATRCPTPLTALDHSLPWGTLLSLGHSNILLS